MKEEEKYAIKQTNNNIRLSLFTIIHGICKCRVTQLTQPPPALECSEILSCMHSYGSCMGYACSIPKNLEINQNPRVAGSQSPFPLFASIHAIGICGCR